MQIGENVGVLDTERDVVVFMELHGQAGTIRSQGSITGIDKKNLKISIDFTKSWEALVKVEEVVFLDLKNMVAGTEKSNYLSVLNSNEQELVSILFTFQFILVVRYRIQPFDHLRPKYLIYSDCLLALQ